MIYTVTMQGKTWYEQLAKPNWAPDASVFGQVWSVLYVIIAAVNIYVLTQVIRGELDWKVGLPFWINLVFNLLFTPIQFGLKNNFLAMLVIYIILGSIVWSTITIWPHNRLLSIAFVPYLVWVSIATVLQTQIWYLNK